MDFYFDCLAVKKNKTEKEEKMQNKKKYYEQEYVSIYIILLKPEDWDIRKKTVANSSTQNAHYRAHLVSSTFVKESRLNILTEKRLCYCNRHSIPVP